LLHGPDSQLSATSVFSHPEALREIFGGDSDELRRGEANRVLTLFGDHSLLVLDGPQHLRERRMMQRPFTARE